MHSERAGDGDWRLQRQERYLQGVTLFRHEYRQSTKSASWDHDHCEFCSEKFTARGVDGPQTWAYSTEDEYRWICEKCFGDFRELFAWRLAPSTDPRDDG